MYKRKEPEINQNKGFTIIEMVVTMLVLAIVMTLSIGGLLAWQDWANFNRQNEYARTLFIAAQNQLTEFDADGRLEELQDALSGGVYDDKTGRHYTAVGLNLTDHISALTNAAGNTYGDLGELYPESGDKEEKDQALYQGEIVSLRAQTGDYASYLADPVSLKASDPDAYWVFELLGAYVYDTSILNGDRKDDGSGNGAAICVEITPDDGQVLAVLYSDKNDKFIYKAITGDPDGSEEETGIADISDRTEAYRKDRMVGYYGVDTLYTATKGEVLKPSISTVRLYNKDDFYLACRLGAKDRNILTSRLTYTMNIHGSADKDDKLLTITLDGTKLKNQANAEVISCPVSRYDASRNESSLGNLPVLAWVEPDYTIHVVLDAADIQATSDLYERELNDIRSTDKVATTKFSKTFSYFRFGVKADNLFASVKADGADFTESEKMYNFGNLNPFLNQLAKHATFAGEDTSKEAEKTRITYSMKNARHLYNMRYIEDLSYEQEAGSPEAADKIAGVIFMVKSDIDWKTFQQSGQLYDTAGNIQLSSLDGKLVNEKEEMISHVTRYNCDFPSFSRIRARDTLVGEKSVFGDTKEITGISVTELSNALYGIYKNAAGEMDTTRPSGLVNVNYGTIKDLKLDQITVSGNQFVGGFCGINAGELDNLETLNKDGTSLISGNKHVGGIMGFQMPTAANVEITGFTNRARVEGVRAVGGIVGMVRNEFSAFIASGSGLVLTELTELSDATKDRFNPSSELTVKISDCTNYGSVLGCSFTDLKEVYTSGEASAVSVEPAQQAENASFDPEESRYIGGIVGYSYNLSRDDTTRVTIVNCTSAPLYEVEELANITSKLSDESNLNQKLKGTYVGGIAGYNYFGQINKCSTKPEKGKVGCLFGYRYVGGIVGFNIGPASGIVGSDTSKPGENQNHVVAYEYAGGITGCNATASDKDSRDQGVSAVGADPEKLTGILIPDAKRALDVKIDNWKNKGVAIAVHEYSGGITGYNAGWIYRCNSEVNEADAEACFTPRDSSNDAKGLYSGNYAGGIAGYNNGIIGNSERTISGDHTDSTLEKRGTGLSTVCYVKGHHYVGGIVGYNDVNSIVEDYEVGSGYVLGDEGSCFVGGYAGLNASVDLLMDRSESKSKSKPQSEWNARFIYSNPNRVKGSYFVGGVIGGNIINKADNSDVQTVNGVFLTDNFLGILEGKAFAGGFIGYNLLFNDFKHPFWDAKEDEKGRDSVYIVQHRLVDAFEKSDASVSDVQTKLVEKKEIVDHLSDKLSLPINSSDQSVLISGRGAENTEIFFGSISGEIYVGGVLGYNDENTKLTIQNVENATAIEVTNAIEYKAEQIRYSILGYTKYRTIDYAGRDKTYTYSYAGGIIGKVSKKTTLDNCRNASTGTVQTAGTYTGGLCEVNEGLIQNCQVSSFGNSMQDYVGGLCGLNKSTITNCTFKNKTVSGRNVVGGITAENFGTISDITLKKSRLLVEGIQEGTEERDGVAGLYAAYNGYSAYNNFSGKIELSEDISDVSVTSGGRYVGLVVGVNEGKIDNTKGNKSDYLVIDGTVRGYQSVGGLIGLNSDTGLFDVLPDLVGIVQYYTNQASVTATNGNAGGIIGENRSQNTISYCINDGVVTASDEGNAGGITSSNSGLIVHCTDYQTVSAPEGMCGGITAVNKKDGVIVDCQVEPREGKDGLTFRSTRVVGGIASQNSGTIASSLIKNVTVINETAVENTNMGVVVGENLTDGKIYLNGSLLGFSGAIEIENCKAIVRSNYSNAGGIAGTNAGTIKGTKGSPAVVSPNLSMENATLASLGGVAGSNMGTIENVAVDAKIQGELGSSMTGYGGIAGVSGYESQEQLADVQKDKDTKEYAAIIKNCSFDGVINAEGSSGAPVRVGGIVGVNGYGSLVQDCCIGVRSSESGGTISDVSKITYITAGDYVNKTADSVNTTDTKSYAYLGGIAGDNYGSILACDNAAKSTDTVKIIGFAGETGGIAGYNEKYGVVSGYLDKDGKTQYLTTSDKWSVEQLCCGNDRGPGGIIGKSVSAEDMSYVKNYAPVTCSYKANTYVAGLIGVLGQQYEMKTKFYKCENYGDINSYRSAGGLVGMLESNGADFVECNNWGNVYGESRCSGGLVAIHYAFAAGLDFRHCANHGNVSGKGEKVGGFVGYEENVVPENYGIDGKVVNYLYDCVNTGIIGKIGKTEPDSNTGVFYGRKEGQSRVIMELCRNYNTNKSTNGFIGNGGDLRFKNCLDDSGIRTASRKETPFGGAFGWNTNMFYLDQSSGTQFSHENYGVYFSFHEGPYGDYDYNGINYRERLRDPSYLFSEPDTSNKIKLYRNANQAVKQLNISLSYGKDGNGKDSQGLDGMVVYFWNGKDEVDSQPENNYVVSATYVYSDGHKKTTSTQSAIGVYGVDRNDKSAKVVLNNPETGNDKKPVQVRLTFENNNSNVYLRGISYIPAASKNVEAVCTYLGRQYDTTFCISEISKMSGGQPVYTYTSFNDSMPIKQTLPEDVWYCYPDDTMDINWTAYTNYRVDFGEADITFDVTNGKKASGMEAFVFYLANENTSKEANNAKSSLYEYRVTFTDKYGKIKTTDVVTDAQGLDSGVKDYREGSKQVVNVPGDLDPMITSLTLHIKANDGNKIYFRGFGWIPEGQDTEQKMAAGTNCTATYSFTDRWYQDGSVNHTHLKVTSNGGENYAYLPYDYNTGFYMTNNPIDDIYYNDTSEYAKSLTTEKNSGSRIDTYLELDPKFMELTEDVCTVERKLTTPYDLAMTDGNASVKITWGRSKDAYAYEVYYEITDSNEKSVFASDHEMIGSLQLEYSIPIDDDWKKGGYSMVFHVRAINAYHFVHDDKTDSDYEKYDSDWAVLNQVISKMSLPKPQVHMEVVAGNRTTFVLDNYEEYVKKNCTDITIKLYYKPSNVSSGTDYTWNVGEEGKYSKPQEMTGSPKGPADFRYYAAPNESLKAAYTTSEVHYQRGEGHGNSDLQEKSAYCKTTFQGFFGTEAGSMDYRIQFTLDSQDTYLMTDILAYDTKVGATVGYDSEITHAANSYSGGGQLKLTSTLKNLPDDWFASDCKDKITVRAYPYHSQFDLIHYGHPVAEGIKLNGTVEENRAVLAGIYDKEYIAKDADNPVSNCVWDEKEEDLKSGYLLQKQDDGTYNIIYSSVIEMSQTAAAELNDPHREYIYYDIAYRIYSNMAAETDNEIVVNSMDFQESYWSRRNTKNDGSDLKDNYNNVETDSNNRQYVQEIQSAPIVSAPAITKDDQGHTVYTFNWDTYYQDTSCWDTGANRYNKYDVDYLTDPPKDLYPTWDAYLKESEHAGPSFELTDYNLRRLMNAYYSSYSKAEYRVDLIGTTQDGKEVILESQMVKTPTQQDTVKNMITKGRRKSTTYNVWDYRCSFTDTNQTWNNYPKITARIMRLGSTNTVSAYRHTNSEVKPFADSNGATCILPRYTDTVVFQKLRLNTISKPTVSLLKENGQFITDDLVYEVAWGAITDKKQKKDLGGYLITASVVESADQTQGSNTHYYYVSDVGTDGDAIGLDTEALKASGVVTDVSKYYTRSGNKCKTQINLSDFNTNDVVQISVKAIARKQAEKYTDGEEGVSIEIKIPKRLAVPDTTKLTVTLAANGSTVTTDPVDMETYQKGLSFRYEPGEDEYASVADAKIRMAVAVCDSAPDTQDDKNQIEVQEWEKNARKVLYTKEKPLNLGKVSEKSSVVVNLTELERYPGEYAGKWLKIALKASSATKIDSQWTDQDPDEKTINYAWVQLPKLNLKDVDLKELSASDEGDVIRYVCDGKITNESTDPNRETPIATKSLRFSEDRNVNGYHIGITGTADSPDGQAPVYDLYLQRHLKDSTNEASFDGTWDVYLSTNGAITVSDDSGQQPVCEQKQEATWIGLIGIPFTNGSDSDNEATQLIEIKDIRKDIEISSVTYSLNAQLRYTVNTADQKGSFVIVLPDVTMIEEIPYSADYFTTEVSVEQYIKEGAPYTEGKGAVYIRGSGIRITAIEKGGDGQHEEDENTVAVRALATIAKIGKFRSSNDHGFDRWSRGAGILSVSPFDRILTVCANIQTNRPAAMQAFGAELFRIIRYGVAQSFVCPVSVFI